MFLHFGRLNFCTYAHESAHAASVMLASAKAHAQTHDESSLQAPISGTMIKSDSRKARQLSAILVARDIRIHGYIDHASLLGLQAYVRNCKLGDNLQVMLVNLTAAISIAILTAIAAGHGGLTAAGVGLSISYTKRSYF